MSAMGVPAISEQTFRAGKRPRHLPVTRAREAQGPRERLEESLDLMVARATVEHLEVHVGARSLRESVEEVADQLRLQIPDPLDRELEIDDGVDAPGEIDRRDAERLVHRHHEIAGAIDPLAV